MAPSPFNQPFAMVKMHQHSLELTPPARQAVVRKGKRQPKNSRRRILAIDYQTWLSLTAHLVCEASPAPRADAPVTRA